eukprot:scpid49453/ scgid34333/ 
MQGYDLVICEFLYGRKKPWAVLSTATAASYQQNHSRGLGMAIHFCPRSHQSESQTNRDSGGQATRLLSDAAADASSSSTFVTRDGSSSAEYLGSLPQPYAAVGCWSSSLASASLPSLLGTEDCSESPIFP